MAREESTGPGGPELRFYTPSAVASCVTSGYVICVSLSVLCSPYLQNEDSKWYLPQRVVVWIPWLKNQIIPGMGPGML